MAQLFISGDNVAPYTVQISADKITIGRRRDNTICLPHLSVSGYHASIAAENGCLVLEDLQSTNGTSVNGQAVKQHILIHSDAISVGNYTLTYSETSALPVAARQGSADIIPLRAVQPMIDPTVEQVVSTLAALKVATGRRAGEIYPLHKSVTTLGKPGTQVGAIARKSTGYYFVPLKGYTFDRQIRHNGNGVAPPSEIKLATGDQLEVAGEQVEFIFPYYADGGVSAGHHQPAFD